MGFTISYPHNKCDFESYETKKKKNLTNLIKSRTTVIINRTALVVDVPARLTLQSAART